MDIDCASFTNHERKLTNIQPYWPHAGSIFHLYLLSDTDECALATDDCSVNAVCNNTMGSHMCICIPPYYGDGWVCAGKLFFKNNKRWDLLEIFFKIGADCRTREKNRQDVRRHSKMPPIKRRCCYLFSTFLYLYDYPRLNWLAWDWAHKKGRK